MKAATRKMKSTCSSAPSANQAMIASAGRRASWTQRGTKMRPGPQMGSDVAMLTSGSA